MPPSKTALLVIDVQKGFLPAFSSHWGPSRSNPAFEENASKIITTYRNLISSYSSQTASQNDGNNGESEECGQQHKIIHVQHCSTSTESPLHPSNLDTFAFQDFAAPLQGEMVITKNVNSAFIGTNLEDTLREHFGGQGGKGEQEDKGRNRLYVIGLTTDHCISTTVRMAGNLGVVNGSGEEKGEVVLISDATACWEKSTADGGEEAGLTAEIVHRVHVQSLREFATTEVTERMTGEWEGWMSE